MQHAFHYLIIGNGRVARHMLHYLNALKLPVSQWMRKDGIESLQAKLRQATHVLLLINDDAIDAFYQTHVKPRKIICLHFSGALYHPDAIGTHPLMTFSDALYPQSVYQTIPFIIDNNGHPFERILPGLNNPHAFIEPQQKAKYHALCVMAGNFSCLLWQKLFSSLENEFNIPAAFAKTYLAQQSQNLLNHPEKALTGPLSRGDTKTIQRNLQSLERDPFKLIYESFVTCFTAISRGE